MRLWSAVSLVAVAISSVDAQTVAPYAIADAVAMRRLPPLSAIQLSPDGKLVAYSLIDPYSRSFSTKDEIRTDRGVPQVMSGSELFVTEVGTGRTRRIGGGSRRSAWAASWAPDGRSLAFFSDDEEEPSLWIWSRISGRGRRASRVVVKSAVIDVPRWTPDGQRIVVKTATALPHRGLATTPAGSTPSNSPRVERFTSRPDTLAADLDTRDRSRVVAERNRSDLSIIDVESGRIRNLARDQPVVNYWLSPNGRAVAFTRMRTDLRLAANVNAFDLVVVLIDSESSRVIARGIAHAFGAMVSWAPDGSRLAFFSSPAPSDTAGVMPPGCYTVRENGDSLRLLGLTSTSVASIFDVPLWNGSSRIVYAVAAGRLHSMPLDGRPVREFEAPEGHEIMEAASRAQAGRLWSPDSEHAIVVTRDTATMRQALVRVVLATGAREIISEDEQMLLGSAGSNPDVFRLDAQGDRLAIVRETASEPPDIWVYDARGENGNRVTRMNPRHARYRFGASRLVSWLSDDGVPLRGALVLPPDYSPSRRYPLVVCVYGGGYLSRSVYSFGGFLSSRCDAQLFATRGYAMFFPDAPQQFGTPLLDLAKTVLPGVSRLVELGIADANRLAIIGHSYGGYSVYSIITQSARFRAAIVSAGVANLISAYGSMTGSAGREEYFEGGQGKIGASLWMARDRYLENSPIFRFDRVRTAVLIIHGARDLAVPIWMADEAFVALRRLGREVEYVRYLDEEHSEWTGAASADMLARVLDFLTTHLGLAQTTRASRDGGDTQR